MGTLTSLFQPRPRGCGRAPTPTQRQRGSLSRAPAGKRGDCAGSAQHHSLPVLSPRRQPLRCLLWVSVHSWLVLERAWERSQYPEGRAAGLGLARETPSRGRRGLGLGVDRSTEQISLPQERCETGKKKAQGPCTATHLPQSKTVPLAYCSVLILGKILCVVH